MNINKLNPKLKYENIEECQEKLYKKICSKRFKEKEIIIIGFGKNSSEI
ncbi:hypothetical protein GF385_01635, partial [Candidatus Dependentiae bacterium]|nr:hypothetical protein [Candidatus Dependentiae bacterium]